MRMGIKGIALFVIVSSAVAFNNAHVIAEEPHDDHNVESDPDLEAYLREAIENFRHLMGIGNDAIKMPVLDPLQLKNLVINVREDAAVLDLRIHEITVRELSKFNLIDLQPNLEHLSIKLKLALPIVRATGRYKIDGKIVKIFPIYGEGNFQINVTNAAISGSGKLDFVSDTLQMTTLSLDLVWEDLAIDLENLLGGGTFAKVLQKVFPAIGKGVFENFKPELMNEINKALKNELNKELRKPEVKNIIKGILPDK